MEKKFIQKIYIPCYDTDLHKLLKPVSFMNYAQEIANRHAEVLGFGYDDLMAANTAWVLSRMCVKFLRHPSWREKTSLETWHKGAERLFYLRDFKMTDESGEPVVLATTSWLVINMNTRRLTRDVSLDESGACDENALEQSCEKVLMPKDIMAESIAEHHVAYSDIDMNGHVNNAMYLQWAMDSIDPSIVSERPLKEFRINFNHEVRPGDTVQLYLAQKDETEKTSLWVEGIIANKTEDKTGGKSAFIVELVY